MDKEREFNSSLKLIAKSSFIVFIGLFFSKILSYIYRIIIAREFGPEAYGLFSLAIMLSGWVGVIAAFGLSDGLLRYISVLRGSKENNKINYLFRRSFFFLFFTGLIGGVLLFISSSFIANNIFREPELKLFLQLFSIAMPFDIAVVAFMSPLRAYEKIGWRSFISNILVNVLNLGFILLFIASGLGIVSIPLSYTVGIFFVFLTAVFVLKKQVPEIFKKSDYKGKNLFRNVLSYSWPLIFAEIIWRIFKWTDSFFIGYFETVADVGFYNAAFPIALLLTFSSDLFMQMFVPLINKEYSKNNIEVVKNLSQQVGKWLFFTNLPILILLFLFPEGFLNILFGKEFIVAADSLRILTIGVLFLSFGGVSTRLLGMLGKSKKILFDVTATAIINLILNILLIPKYGITGAAVATSFSFIVLSLILIIQVYMETKIIPIRRKNLNILIAVIISSSVLLLVKPLIAITPLSLILLSIFFLAFYTLLVFIFKGFDRNDFMIFRTFLRKG
ncbi:MAG: flippase [Nanoarchaeota archaeon]